MKTLTVTKAARNLADCVERVYQEGESFKLVQNGVAQALLVPVNGTHCNSHQLADDLSAVKISVADRRALRAAVRQGRKSLKRLKNPWA